jgi:hypothetical protein
VEDIGTLVLGTSVHPDLFALPVRQFVTFSSNAMIDSWVYDGLEEDLPINSGGSVSNVAFSVAARLGCDPIIVVGQDLSFPDGRYYASTTSDGDARVTVTAEGASVVVGASDGYRELEPQGPQSIFLREVPGYYGGTVPTSFALRKAWSWFVDEAKRQAGQRTLLNCTEGGAYIEGMEHVPLAEAAERYAREAVPIEPVVDRVVAQIDRERRRRHMLERVTEMRTALSRCMDQARACRVLAERARRRPEYLSKLKAAEERLTRSLESMPFISTMVQPEMRVAMAAGKQASSVEDSLDASMGVYDAVIRVSLALRGPFERACESVRRPSTFVLRSA